MSRETRARSSSPRLQKVLSEVRQGTACESTVGLVYGSRSDRVAAELWSLLAAGEDLSPLSVAPGLLAQGEVDGDLLLAYFRQLGAATPAWARMGNPYSDAENNRGWNADLEQLLRACRDRLPLARGWGQVRGPVGGALAFALARLGDLPPADLPDDALPRFALAFVDVFDYERGHEVFEGVERVWTDEAWARAVIAAALRDDVERISVYAAHLAPYVRHASPRERVRLIAKLTWPSEDVHGWLDTCEQVLLSPRWLSRELGRARARGFLSDGEVQVLTWWARALARNGSALPKTWDPALTRMLAMPGGLRALLSALPSERRERLILAGVVEHGRDAWEAAGWFVSDALVEHAILDIAQHPKGSPHAARLLCSAGDQAIRRVAAALEDGSPLTEFQLWNLVEVLSSATSREGAALALTLSGHSNDALAGFCAKRLFTYPLDDLREALPQLMGGSDLQRAAGAALILRHSYAPEVRVLAEKHGLTWAARFEPELAALVDGARDAELHARLVRQSADELVTAIAAARARGITYDVFASTLIRWLTAHPRDVAMARAAARMLAPHSQGFALAVFKWLFASARSPTVRSVRLHGSDWEPFDFIDADDARHPTQALADFAPGTRPVAAALEHIIDVGGWPNDHLGTALRWLAQHDPGAAMPRLRQATRAADAALVLTATDVLTDIGEPAWPTLAQMLRGSESEVRVAAEVLTAAPTASLIEALRSCPYPTPRVAAALDACCALRVRERRGPARATSPSRLEVTPLGATLDSPILDIQLAAGDRRIFVGTASKLEVRQRDGSCVYRRDAIANVATSLAPDGKTLAIAHPYHAERVDLETQAPFLLTPDDGLHSAFALSGGSVLTMCAAANAYHPIVVWAPNGEPHEHALAGVPMRGSAFASGQRYAVCLSTNEVSIRESGAGELVHELVPQRDYEEDDDAEVVRMWLADRDRTLWAMTQDGSLLVWSTDDGRLLAQHPRRLRGQARVCASLHSPYVAILERRANLPPTVHVFHAEGTLQGALTPFGTGAGGPHGWPLVALKQDCALIADARSLELWDLGAIQPVAHGTAAEDDDVSALGAGAETFLIGTAGGHLVEVR